MNLPLFELSAGNITQGATQTAAQGVQTAQTFAAGAAPTLFLAIILIAIAVLVLWPLRKLIVNSLLGIVGLFLLQLLGVAIPINLVTIIISAALGLVGLGLMVLAYYLGFRF